MSNIRDLKTPPIKEAILSVSFKNLVEIEQLQKFLKSDFIITNYPDSKNLMEMQLELQGNLKPQIHKQAGYILKCGPECNRQIKIKVGQLSFHNTKAYIGWTALYKEFQEIWKTYCSTVGAMDLTQISARYINEIDIDLSEGKTLKDYSNFMPAMPTELTASVNNFFLQANIASEDKTLKAIITETTTKTKEGKVKLILDTNVIKVENLKCNSEEMWSSFTNIRSFKNQIFFSCLTEKSIQKYE